MSGTSLDGVDLVYVKFDANDRYSFKILSYETIPYSRKWKKIIQDAFYFSKQELIHLDKKYGEYLSELITNFIAEKGIERIDFIASHGHTIHHQPEKKYTLQIGSGAIIAQNTGIKTICDFRTQDVNLGGQGAPLVPIGDAFLFSDYTYCLNLGGFANVSFQQEKKRLAFDICPVNIVLNHYVCELGLDYDDKGGIASKGTVHNGLLSELNKISFYSQKAPKSLGFEFVQEIILPLIDSFSLKIKDILRTFIEHVAIQVGNNIAVDKSVFVTGGGAFNEFLIKRITEISKAVIVLPSTEIIDYKEALIFAFLGLRKLENKVNCLKSVTGASKDHCSGVLFF